MNKRHDLLAKYLADLSKIFFSAVIVRQFIERQFNLIELTIGLSSAILLFVFAYFIQPKE
jgi:hypothetical protein